MKKLIHISLGFALLLVSSACARQENAATVGPDAAEEKAAKVVNRAIESLGGRAYLEVRSVVGRGQFTRFQGGMAGASTPFTDYQVFPDRERTEFHIQGMEFIQVTTANTGWISDPYGASREPRVATPSEIQ